MDFLNNYLLTILLFLPLASLIVVPLLKDSMVKPYGHLLFIVETILVIYALNIYDSIGIKGSVYLYEFSEIYPSIGLNYVVGTSSIGLLLSLTTIFILSYAFTLINTNLKGSLIAINVALTGLIGVFISINLLQFYIFWEFSLLPMVFLILTQGRDGKIEAAYTFFIYTFLGSLFLLAGILILGVNISKITGTIDFNYLSILNHVRYIQSSDKNILFVLFFIAFAFKIPLVPFHLWMPRLYKSSPVSAIIISSMLLKMGVFGIYQILIPILDTSYLSIFITFINIYLVFSVVYSALIACVKEDLLEIFAYSSISHMGVIALALLSLNSEGIGGAIFFMISHSLTTTFAFILLFMMYKRSQTTRLNSYGGIAHVMPKISVLFGVSMLCSVGQPLTVSFVGEFLSLLGFFNSHMVLGIIVTVSIVLSAIYMLRLFKNIFYGDIKARFTFDDIKGKEFSLLFPLLFLVLFLGIYPSIILDSINSGIKNYTHLTSSLNKNISLKKLGDSDE